MKSRILLPVLAIALLIPLSGCPSEPLLGLWVFTQPIPMTDPFIAGLILQANGQTAIPDPRPPQANGDFAGEVTWMRNGTTFTMTQDTGSSTLIFTGTIQTDTFMDGTWRLADPQMGNGTWYAYKL